MQRTDEEIDEAFVRAAIAGDHAAFAALYARHRARVAARLGHLLGPSALVDDLVQDTFLRAHRALPAFRGDCPFRFWLLRIATHAARGARRSLRRALWRLFADPSEERALAGRVAAAAEAYPELVAVHAALDRLSPVLREAIVLFELEGRTLQEIALELGVSIHTVGARVRRGRVALRRELVRTGGALGRRALLPCPGGPA